MTTVADVGFVEMRLSKVVGVSAAQDDPSFCMVLEGVSQDRKLPIWIGETEALHLAATLTGVEFGRPMSAQFAAGLLRALGGRVRQVRIDRLVAVRGGSAYGSTVEVEGPSGVALVQRQAERRAEPGRARARADLRRPGGAGGRGSRAGR